MNKTVFVCSTFGNCEYNSYVSTQLGEFFRLNGIRTTANADEAGHIVVNTCGVDSAREGAAMEILAAMTEAHRDKRIIITGCLTKISRALMDDDSVIKVPPRMLDMFDELFDAKIPISGVAPGKMNSGYLRPGDNQTPELFYIRISIGCSNSCAYCSIKKAKGGVVSEPVEDIVARFGAAVEAGEKKISLLSDECGSFGADIGTNFARLLNSLLPLARPETGIYIHYIDPARLVALLPEIDPAVFRHIRAMNVPLQATAARVLQLMGRKNDTEETLDALRRIKALNKNIALSTNIIYAFPGETAEEFEDTFRVKGVFDSVVYYCYSEREGTRAASFDGKVAEDERIRRTRRVMSEAASDPRIVLAYEHLSEIGLDDFKPAPKLYVFKQ